MKLNKGTPFDRNWINGYTLIRHLKRWINPGSGSPGNLEHVCLTLAVQLEDTCRILVVVRFPCGAKVVPALSLFLRARHAPPTSFSLLHSIVALLSHHSALGLLPLALL